MAFSYPTPMRDQTELALIIVFLLFVIQVVVKILRLLVLLWAITEHIRANPWPHVKQHLQIIYTTICPLLLVGAVPALAVYAFTQNYPHLQPITLVRTFATNAPMLYGMLLLTLVWSIMLCSIAMLGYAYAYIFWITWQILGLNRHFRPRPKHRTN
jgi:membrane-associated HD superfamily phosphohydrolase